MISLSLSCRYVRSGYTSLTLQELFAKTVSVTVDLSAATCGCAASFRLVPMVTNSEPGRCDGDYYCDAAASCGVSCAEITLFEANRHAFKARVDDNAGGGGVGACMLPTLTITPCASLSRLARASHCAGNGLGGSSSAWGGSEAGGGSEAYGPHGTVIDTTKPFRMHAHFLMGTEDGLGNIEITLQQGGAALPQELTFLVADSSSHHSDAGASQGYINQVAEALGSRGLTPVLEYRSAESMSTLDSPPCHYYAHNRGDEQDDCGEIVRFADISISSAPSPPPPPAAQSDAEREFNRLFDSIVRHHSEQPPTSPGPAPPPPLPPPRRPPPPPIPQWPIQGLPLPPPPQPPALPRGWRPNDVLLALLTLCGIVVWLLTRHSRGRAGNVAGKKARSSADHDVDALPGAVDLQLERLPPAPTEPSAD